MCNDGKKSWMNYLSHSLGKSYVYHICCPETRVLQTEQWHFTTCCAAAVVRNIAGNSHITNLFHWNDHKREQFDKKRGVCVTRWGYSFILLFYIKYWNTFMIVTLIVHLTSFNILLKTHAGVCVCVCSLCILCECMLISFCLYTAMCEHTFLTADMYVLKINTPSLFNSCLSLHVCECKFVMTSLLRATLLLYKT